MTLFNIFVYLAIFIIIFLITRGIVFYVWSFFRPLKYIKVTIKDENGNKQTSKLYIKDEELLDKILVLRRKQKLAQGNNSAK